MKEFLGKENVKFYGVIVTVSFFFVPLTVILGAYGTIFQIARAHARGRGVSSFKKVLLFRVYYQPFEMVLENSSLQISKWTKVYYFSFKGHEEKRWQSFWFILKLKPHYIYTNYATLSRGSWPRGDTNKKILYFWVRLGSDSTPNLALQEQRTRELNIFQHKKRDFVSSSVHVMFYLLYKHHWNTIPFHFRCEGRHLVCNHSNDDFHVWRYLVFTRKLTWYFIGL